MVTRKGFNFLKNGNICCGVWLFLFMMKNGSICWPFPGIYAPQQGKDMVFETCFILIYKELRKSDGVIT